jgi:hypothetical protein
LTLCFPFGDSNHSFRAQCCSASTPCGSGSPVTAYSGVNVWEQREKRLACTSLVVSMPFCLTYTGAESLHFGGSWTHVGPGLASLSRGWSRRLGRVCRAGLCPALPRCVRGCLAPLSRDARSLPDPPRSKTGFFHRLAHKRLPSQQEKCI